MRRVLDSTPWYDAVATMDTVTLLGAAIRGVLKVADQALKAELRGVLVNGEEYASLAKPQIDWDDQQVRAACANCPLWGRCTSATGGRTITAYEQELVAARTRQADPDRAASYRATRPKVERKLAHLVRRRHGGRRVRVRGLDKAAADFNLLAAAVNLTGWACSACTGPRQMAGRWPIRHRPVAPPRQWGAIGPLTEHP
jgi:hypothetical protein